MILYTADLHFGHANIILLDHRPFADVEEMDEYLIARWNDRVQTDDEVYILGDVVYKSGKDPSWYLRRLKGRKHLIYGNHDGFLKRNPALVAKYFESAEDVQAVVDQGKQIFLCHYPLAEWPGYFRGAIHVYGHIHNNTTNDAYKFISTQANAYNAGCMINGYAPVSLRELRENNKRFQEEAGKRKSSFSGEGAETI